MLVLFVQFSPSAVEQTSTAFPGLLAMNATYSLLLKTANDGPNLLVWPIFRLFVQLTPSPEEQTRTASPALLAMNEVHRLLFATFSSYTDSIWFPTEPHK